MKLKQNSPLLLAVFAFSQKSFVFVQAAKNSIEEQGSYDPDSRMTHSSFQSNFSKQANPPKETTVSSPVVVASSSSSSSSSLLRRTLKTDSKKYFFFEQCSDICMENNGVPTILDDCCHGGVSYLKVKFHAQDQINGTITLGSTHSPSCDDSQAQLGSKGTKAGFFDKSLSASLSQSTYEHRLVDCNASCIQNPFGGNTCDEDQVLHEKKVEHGSDICFAMVKSVSIDTYEITFDEKMPTDINVLFLSSEGFSVGFIHTSCSVPLSKPWGVRFDDACTHSSSGRSNKIHSHEKHIKISDITDDSTPYLSFVDGISTKYFSAVEDVLRAPDTSSYVQDYSIQFKNCGCTCERFNATSSATPSFSSSLDPSTGAYPSLVPSEGPTSKPTFVPSLAPSEAPTPSPPTNLSSMPTKVEVVNPSFNPSSVTSEVPTPIPTFAPSLTSSEAPTSSPTTNLSSIPTKIEVANPSSNPSTITSEVPTPIPTFAPSLASSEAPTSSPTTNLSSIPTKESVIDSSSNPSFISTEASTFATTSSSTPTKNPPANPGPGSPSGSTCNSACASFILEQCVFVGTNEACNINSEVPEIADDDQEEVGDAATFPLVASATELFTANEIGKFSKGTKGKKGFGKGFGKGGSGKVGKKGEKVVSSGKAFKNNKGRKDMGEIISHSESDLPKKRKGKVGEGGQHFSDSGHKRHLQKIEYHQSRIDYFKKLLAHTEV